MQDALQATAIRGAVASLAVRLDRHFGARLKRAMLAILAAWLGYFAIIRMSLRMLDKLTVPLLDVPLGGFLVVQGTLIMFLAALVLLVKASALAGAGR